MGSRYLFIVLYVWLEKALSRGDYRVSSPRRDSQGPVGSSQRLGAD
jgi:dolichol-phosphate mannosyltransferase